MNQFEKIKAAVKKADTSKIIVLAGLGNTGRNATAGMILAQRTALDKQAREVTVIGMTDRDMYFCRTGFPEIAHHLEKVTDWRYGEVLSISKLAEVDDLIRRTDPARRIELVFTAIHAYRVSTEVVTLTSANAELVGALSDMKSRHANLDITIITQMAKIGKPHTLPPSELQAYMAEVFPSNEFEAYYLENNAGEIELNIYKLV